MKPRFTLENTRGKLGRCQTALKLPKRPGKNLELPETVSSVPYWGGLVHPKDGRSKVFCVLHAYLDDSGTHDSSPVCVVSGYFGSERHWRIFDEKWRAVLGSFEIEEFHANKFWAYTNGANITEHRGWDDDKCARLIESLLETISESQCIYPVGCSVDMNEWSALTKEERAFLTGATYDTEDGRLKTPGAPNKTFFLPFVTAIAAALDYCNWGNLMHFTLDANKKFAAYALDYFQQLKNSKQGNYRKMGDLIFSDSKVATPIQAADLLAYEIYQHSIRRINAGNAKVNPTPAMVYAMQNSRDGKSVPFFEKTAFANTLALFREAQAKGNTK